MARPVREGRDAYERYLAGMDASMKQKVALTAAHLLCEGRVADMGMGSGAGSEALAALYPRLEVVGVDLDETMVALAREKYRRENLSFVVGDIAKAVLPPGSLDGIFDSSVLHHVTSFGGYRHENAADALRVQAGMLKEGGVLVVRDFVDPGAGEVLLDLREADGDAALFERFAREFRSLAKAKGFAFARAEGAPEGWRRYRLAHKHAAEFVLRKDYRADWESEVKEEYTYFTQVQFEALFTRLGLRVLASTPLWNPWIVKNRFRGKFVLRDVGGAPTEDPPTNYVIVGEKVAPGAGVAFAEEDAAPIGYLHLDHYRHRKTGARRDLARRPNAVIDVLPHFEERGARYVVARMSYPRPVLGTRRASPPLDGARAPAYVTEPLSVVLGDRPVGQTVEEALAERAGIVPARIRGFAPGAVYYPSPGGTQEEVRSVLVEVEPVFVQAPPENTSGFSASGRVRAIEARQLLRAAQVGGLPDARLEMNVYELLLTLGEDRGPWIGEAPSPREAERAPQPRAEPPAPRRMFERVDAGAGFLDLCCARFEERDAEGRAVASRALEFVAPRGLSTNTVATAPLLRHGGEVYLGVDDDDLPAAQAFNGNSNLWVAPAWRLPRAVASITPARAWVCERLRAEYGVECGEVWELGGRYFPSPGVSPEVVYPIAVEAREAGAGLRWLPLREAVAARALLLDGHLRVVALRAAHALGQMGPAV